MDNITGIPDCNGPVAIQPKRLYRRNAQLVRQPIQAFFFAVLPPALNFNLLIKREGE